MTNQILHVDFGDTSDDHLLPVLTTSELAPGEPVVLTDDDGNVCAGTVSRIEGRIVWVEPVWPTWTTSGVAVSFANATYPAQPVWHAPATSPEPYFGPSLTKGLVPVT